jgi:hypothetical protein
MANIRSPLVLGANTFETFVRVPGTIFHQLNSSSLKRDLYMKQSAEVSNPKANSAFDLLYSLTS